MAAPSLRKKVDHKAALAGAKLPERSVELCLRGDLLAQLQDLQRDLIDAERAPSDASLADLGTPHRIAEQIQGLREEMAEHSITVRFRALPRRQWSKLVAAHPPRPDERADVALGVNVETYVDALIRACMVDPVFDDDDWAALDEALSDAQWQALTAAAWAVNAKDVEVPFSQRASRILASSAPE